VRRWEASETGIAERAVAQQNGCFRGVVAESESGHVRCGLKKAFAECRIQGESFDV